MSPVTDETLHYCFTPYWCSRINLLNRASLPGGSAEYSSVLGNAMPEPWIWQTHNISCFLFSRCTMKHIFPALKATVLIHRSLVGQQASHDRCLYTSLCISIRCCTRPGELSTIPYSYILGICWIKLFFSFYTPPLLFFEWPNNLLFLGVTYQAPTRTTSHYSCIVPSEHIWIGSGMCLVTT